MGSPNQPIPVVLQCPRCGANLPPGTEGYTVCQYCGVSLILPEREGEPSSPQEAPVQGIRLKPFIYTDKEGTGLELFRMLIPVGWQVQGGIRWLLDNPGMPAAINTQIFNPEGGEMFEILPNMNFTWNNNPITMMAHPVGSRYFGAEVRPPVGIQQALRDLVLPRYRHMGQGLEILHEELLPDLPQQARSEALTSGGSAEGGKVRIRYTWKGKQYDEEIYGVVEIFRAPIASMFGSAEVLVWFVDFLFTFRAAIDRLDATANLFKVMIGSFRLNGEWYAAFKSISQTLAQRQIQRIQHIGQIGQILAQTGSALRQQNLNDWYARQEVFDRLATDRSRALRGVEAFVDSTHQAVVELPAGYGNAWVNNQGEYIVTAESSFDPNRDSNTSWERMERQ